MKSLQRSRKFYLNIQFFTICVNFAFTLALFSLSVWINFGGRFRFLNSVTNRIIYSALYRILGLYPPIILCLNSVEVLLNVIQFVEYFHVARYLNTSLKSLRTSNDGMRLLMARKYIGTDARRERVIVYVKVYTFMVHFVYIFVMLSFKIFVAVFFLVHFKRMLTYQLPLTMVKIIREYERIKLDEFNHNLLDFGMTSANATSGQALEVKLVDLMHVQYQCCNYQNPYQFGDLTPTSCNLAQGCLRPVQDFVWNYLYFSIVVLLFTAGVKICIQLIFLLNFYLLFLRKIMYKMNRIAENGDADDEEDEAASGEAKRRLLEIRRQKEAKLALEEQIEEERRLREEQEMKRLLELERLQDEYELNLFKQKRFDELKNEQLKRRLEYQHLNEKKLPTASVVDDI